MKFDKEKLMNLAKIGVTVAGVGITLAQNYFANKDLDNKVQEQVAKVLENQAKESK